MANESQLPPSSTIPGATEIRDWNLDVGGATSIDRRNNLLATRNPTSSDDQNSGYRRGSLWVFGSTIWQLVNSTPSAAVWVDISSGGSSSDFTLKTSAFTAEAGKSYLAQGTFSVTDPAPVAGGIYTVLVSSGSVTIGGTAYGPSSLPVVRTSDGSTWTTVASPVQLTPSFIFPSGGSVYGNIPDSWKNGNATVTGLLIGNSVTSIGNNAFYNCSALTGSATIPNSVTTIGSGAFQNCSALTGSLTLGNSVTTIGNNAFRNCSGFTGSLTIPNSVTTIGSYVFYNCSGFTSLTLGNSVTTIGSGAFQNCSGFTGSLTIPNSVTSIGSGAFYNCSGFTGSLTLGNSVTTIGTFAFYNCSGFTGSLTIPNSVTTIGSYVFYNCSGLTNVNAYVAKSVLDVTQSLTGTSVTTIHARASDGTWTASAGQTIGGKTGITVIKDL